MESDTSHTRQGSFAILGIPELTQAHPGIDRMGRECRVDPSVSVMRYGSREGVLQLADRVSVYANTRLVLGDVDIDPCVSLHIGARTIVNVGGYLSGEGGLEIGEDVLIGPGAKILSAGHAIDEGDSIIARNKITIEDGAWIGAGAVVLEGVRIGRGAVVAAGAVLRQDVPAGAVAAGIPAKIVRMRQINPCTDSNDNSGNSCWHSVTARLWARLWAWLRIF